MAEADAAPADKLKESDVIVLRPPVGVKSSVTAPAVPVRVKSVKSAIPLTTVIVVVPLRVPAPVALDAVTLPLKPVTVLPLASIILIEGWVVKETPLTAPDG